jgi:hypothetical protein
MNAAELGNGVELKRPNEGELTGHRVTLLATDSLGKLSARIPLPHLGIL